MSYAQPQPQTPPPPKEYLMNFRDALSLAEGKEAAQ